ncbi:hypothetical protein APHDU1_0497 [Anaplasma phagocytophilum]|nr:hypothetical protein APHDU1_0497 [Anaplasma phagocytophilum]
MIDNAIVCQKTQRCTTLQCKIILGVCAMRYKCASDNIVKL